eukprot:TRINITY_DN38501_c0_g1_i2.p1 TRINITY_DN38501_c0_g1~~TRINITY_DN38501_c0_g1_i2.p1  ORF type:complete len:384 (+),score=62.93 TRINITY_DN38501_c0_g1_i2:102-1154(+)
MPTPDHRYVIERYLTLKKSLNSKGKPAPESKIRKTIEQEIFALCPNIRKPKPDVSLELTNFIRKYNHIFVRHKRKKIRDMAWKIEAKSFYDQLAMPFPPDEIDNDSTTSEGSKSSTTGCSSSNHPPEDNIRSNHKENSFTCKVCHGSFYKEIHLNRHMEQKHPEQTAFPCETCRKGFCLKAELMRHTEVEHYEQTDHPCNACEIGFRRKGLLSKHMTRVHPRDATFTCDVCKVGYDLEDLLRKHMAKKHPDYHVSCDMCSKSFDMMLVLNKHVSNIHAQKVEEEERLRDAEKHAKEIESRQHFVAISHQLDSAELQLKEEQEETTVKQEIEDCLDESPGISDPLAIPSNF